MSGPNFLRREPRNLSLSLSRAARRSAASSPPRRKSGFTELSVGVVRAYASNQRTLDEYVQRADTLMYENKNRRKHIG